MHDWRRVVGRLLLAQLCVLTVYAVVIAGQPDLWGLQGQIIALDKDLSGRVRVLESDMMEVKWLARAVAVAVIGQLVIASFSLRDRRRPR